MIEGMPEAPKGHYWKVSSGEEPWLYLMRDKQILGFVYRRLVVAESRIGLSYDTWAQVDDRKVIIAAKNIVRSYNIFLESEEVKDRYRNI